MNIETPATIVLTAYEVRVAIREFVHKRGWLVASRADRHPERFITSETEDVLLSKDIQLSTNNPATDANERINIDFAIARVKVVSPTHPVVDDR